LYFVIAFPSLLIRLIRYDVSIPLSTVINAYANKANTESGINSDRLLRQMISRYLLGDFQCKPNAVAFTATIKAHSAAINATIASSVENNEQHSTELIQASAKRCEDLLQQMLLIRRGNEKSLTPTPVTFDLVLSALNQARDLDAVNRVQMLRSEENNDYLSRGAAVGRREFKSRAKSR
jgi:signal transduction histidine kinase